MPFLLWLFSKISNLKKKMLLALKFYFKIYLKYALDTMRQKLPH